MKTTRRVFAIVLAALMLAMMIPFAASAATETVSFKVNCDKDGYEFEVYQLATLDTQTGAYTKTGATDAIFSLITDKAKDTSDILTAADAATFSSPVANTAGNTTYVSKSGEATYSVTSGIYYIKNTKAPSTVKSVTNSIVALPYYQNDAWVKTLGGTINLAEKVKDGTVDVTKKINDNGVLKDSVSQFLNKDVTFRLTASVVGSSEKKLTNYMITDTMSAGLTYKDVVSVKLIKDSETATLAAADYSKEAGNGTYSFAFKLSDNVLNGTTTFNGKTFYDFTDVQVEYRATVNTSAVIGGVGNPNSDGLTWTNDSDTYSKDGTTVKVFTYKIKAVKVDANSGAKLGGAEFAIYDNAACTGTALATATTANGTGEGVFVVGNDEYSFKAGTYYVLETKAPAGYNLNSKPTKVEIGDGATQTTAFEARVEDTPAKLPQTGGAGTMMFTVIGGSMILLAGVLFVVVMKKRASK